MALVIDLDLNNYGHVIANASFSKACSKKRGRDEVIDNLEEVLDTPDNKRPKLAKVESTIDAHKFDGVAASRRLQQEDLLAAQDLKELGASIPPATTGKPKKPVLLPEDQYVERIYGEPLWTPTTFQLPTTGFVLVICHGTSRGTQRYLIKARRISPSLWNMLTAAHGIVLEYAHNYTKPGSLFGDSFEEMLRDADRDYETDESKRKLVIADSVYEKAAGRLLSAFDVCPGEDTRPQLYDEIKRIGHPVPEGARVKFGKNITACIEIDENDAFTEMGHEYDVSSDDEMDLEH
jgi:hypothetical protein